MGIDKPTSRAFSSKKRPTNSLSGGETFLASLSLALGLADTVQRRNGGVRIDCLFVDEGFGALDTDALDLAIDTLAELRAGGRTVGVISHVEGVKQRLDLGLGHQGIQAFGDVIGGRRGGVLIGKDFRIERAQDRRLLSHRRIAQPLQQGCHQPFRDERLRGDAAQVVAGASGPALDVFFLTDRLNRYQIIATKAVTQTLSHAMKIVYFTAILSAADQVWPFSLWLVPMLMVIPPLGSYLGKQVLHRVSDRGFLSMTRYAATGIGMVWLFRGVHLMLTQ